MDETPTIYTLERPAGDGQLIVTYVNRDSGGQADIEGMMGFIAEDAARRLVSGGWRLVSVGGVPMRQMGTAGNILFQSGGQYATQDALIAIYARLGAPAGAPPGPGAARSA